MSAAILHLHRNTDVNTAVILPEARLLIGKDVKVMVSAERLSVMCAPPGVVVVREPQGNSAAEVYAEITVDNMLNLEACMRGNKSQQHFPRFWIT